MLANREASCMVAMKGFAQRRISELHKVQVQPELTAAGSTADDNAILDTTVHSSTARLTHPGSN